MPGFPSVFELSSLNGANGFTVFGAASEDLFGTSVSSAGDLNGDGYDDVIIGAPNADPNGTSSGASYVVFGKASGYLSTVDLGSLDGTNGFRVVGGFGFGERSGFSVSSAGDVNGDGYDDLIIGAPDFSGGTTKQGISYLLFGKSTPFSATILAEVQTTEFVGSRTGNYSGQSVSSAGDVNGDGYDDFIIGAIDTPSIMSSPGGSYVVFGDSSRLLLDLNLSDLNGSNGFKLNAIGDRDRSGSSVSGAGDINGDGFDDILIGAPGAQSERGASYVVFGRASGFSASMNLSSLDGSNGFELIGELGGDRSGFSVSSAGDVNGDGYDDIIIGAPEADPNGSDTGASYVLFGKESGFSRSVSLSGLSGANGFKIVGSMGPSTGEASGWSVSSAGDVNGDGYDDLIVGAQTAGGPTGSFSGASYVVFGKASDFSSTLRLSNLNGNDGFKILGAAAGNRSGYSVSSAGDVNRDGFDDIIVGAPGTDSINGSFSGSAYVIFGQASAPTYTIAASFPSVTEGDNAAGYTITYTVTRTGDVSESGAVNVAFSGTAEAGNDYMLAGLTSGAVSFAAEARTATFTLQTTPDTILELNETVVATLGAVIGGGTLGAESVAITTIVNDDLPPGRPPTDISLSSASVREFARNGTTIGTLLAADADASDTLTFKLLDDAGGRFALSGNTVKVANSLLLDYEQARSDTVTVRVTDAQGNNYAETFTIAIKDVNPEVVVGSNSADTLVGGALADKLSGAAGTDRLAGGAGNDTLDGGTGLDILRGSTGNDTYFIDSIFDNVIESRGSAYGIDTIRSSVSIKTLAVNVEKLVFSGSSVLSGTGNVLANMIVGNTAANTLNGDFGKDVLIGGLGKDTFFFNTKLSAANLDQINDFKAVDDTIKLENTGSGMFSALAKGGLNADEFALITSSRAIVDTDAHILYDQAQGSLYYDVNGGSASGRVAFAVLDNHASLTYKDFLIL